MDQRHTRDTPPPDPEKARATRRKRALRWAAGREVTPQALHQRLKSWGAEEAEARDFVGAAVAAGLVDEQRFAEAWVDARRGSRGRRLLGQELRERGVGAAAAARAVASIDPGQERAAARALLARLSPSDLDDPAVRRRARARLERRGFSAGAIQAALGGPAEDT